MYSLRTCSACAGDYEDPDRTAPPSEAEWADEEGKGLADEEDFLDGGTVRQE